MKRGMTGRYITTTVADEQVRAFVPNQMLREASLDIPGLLPALEGVQMNVTLARYRQRTVPTSRPVLALRHDGLIVGALKRFVSLGPGCSEATEQPHVRRSRR